MTKRTTKTTDLSYFEITAIDGDPSVTPLVYREIVRAQDSISARTIFFAFVNHPGWRVVGVTRLGDAPVESGVGVASRAEYHCFRPDFPLSMSKPIIRAYEREVVLADNQARKGK